MSYYLSSFIILFLICLLKTYPTKLRQCEKTKDTFGQWISSALVNQSITELGNIRSHFIEYNNSNDKIISTKGINTALHYSQIWIPNNCSYHRFTNESIHKSVDILLKNNNKISNRNFFHIIFMGDSALRGIFCGLTRVLSGSEIHGPCINTGYY